MKPEQEALFEYLVQKEDELSRLDKFVVSIYEGLSRTTIQTMIKNEMLQVNGKLAKANLVVKPGDLIQIWELPITEMELIPENIPLAIVYEDDDVLVVDKPTGMVVHPAPGHYTGTLVNALLYHIQTLSKPEETLRPGIVHRIDKDTSGLLMVAKNDFAHQALQAELKDKKTQRAYLALVDGVVLHQSGKIDAPIGRDSIDRKKMAVVENGKPSVTHFNVVARYRGMTLLECRLETGRTHQIRVHLAYIGYPVVGDPIYGKKKLAAETGQYLHAKTLAFTHPKTKQLMTFDSPLPPYFEQYLKTLEKFADA
ncbi:MAG: RluA family pseudouridine synthase [Bacillus subtilis]|nr:RluA family pseudouridine synthase [Bacillus subtilis]